MPQPSAKKALTSSFYADVFKQFASNSTGKRPRSEDEDEGEKEVEKYLQLPLLEKDEDPLTW